MQTILFAATVGGERDEDVAAHERAKRGRRFRAETARRLRLDAFEEACAQEEALHVFRLVREDFFGEVVEDVALGLSKNLHEVGRSGRLGALRERVALRDLSDELQRSYPAVRALAVLRELFGRQFEVEDRAEKFARLLVRKQ